MEKAVEFRTIMNEPYRDHPSDDVLERFLLNQSEEDELEIVETHYLACEACVTRLETLQLNISAIKLHLQTQEAERAAKLAQPTPARSKLFSWATWPQLSFAGAALAACAIAVTFVSIPRQVNLVAERGNETISVFEWVPLDLHLQSRDLTPGPVTVEMVDGSGRHIWQSAAVIKNDEIQVKGPRLTVAGSYLVRVYSPTTSAALGDLLREYSISAKPLF